VNESSSVLLTKFSYLFRLYISSSVRNELYCNMKTNYELSNNSFWKRMDQFMWFQNFHVMSESIH